MESLLLLITVIIFFSLQFPSPASSQGDSYFIVCGSVSNVTVEGREFVADSGSAFLNSTGDTAANASSNSDPLYRTARIFTNASAYEFPVAGNRTHVVRLHFSPFASQTHNLSSAVFDASISGFPLLRGFTAVNGNATLKEYFLKPDGGKLVISFVPRQSSFAFVNAIEVFLAPVGLINETVRVVGRESNDDLSGKALEKLYRINVGGPQITTDTLWRTWIPDVLVFRPSAKAVNTSSPITYGQGMIPQIAPQSVYATAQQMNPDGNAVSNEFNMTWSFLVTNALKYLVRLHFCNIANETNPLQFPVYISGSSAGGEVSLERLVARYADFVAEPDVWSHINVSVGASQAKNSVLNGLEIMAINEAAVGSSSSSKKKLPVGVLVGSVLGGLAVISLLGVAFLLVFRRRKKKAAGMGKQKVGLQGTMWSPISMHEGNSNAADGEEVNPSVLPNLGLKISLQDILLATDNFNVSSLVGTGGFGNVYKGVLKDGTNVAVKRAKPESGQGLSEFVAEVTVLSKIRHRHLVSLIGFCDEQSEMILVYEFMEKGTLRNHLYGSDLPPLPWKQRLQICIDSARGLDYLHTGSSQGIIHRDVKSVNILLDEEYVAKVADFGLSKAIESLDKTHVSTFVKGTFGYLDPEYYKRHQITDKSDVFAFGVVLLEVLCARAAVDNTLPREQVNLSE
ncbi:hypothetical protein ACLOJK_032247 [Asimina triloba]